MFCHPKLRSMQQPICKLLQQSCTGQRNPVIFVSMHQSKRAITAIECLFLIFLTCVIWIYFVERKCVDKFFECPNTYKFVQKLFQDAFKKFLGRLVCFAHGHAITCFSIHIYKLWHSKCDWFLLEGRKLPHTSHWHESGHSNTCSSFLAGVGAISLGVMCTSSSSTSPWDWELGISLSAVMVVLAPSSGRGTGGKSISTQHFCDCKYHTQFYVYNEYKLVLKMHSILRYKFLTHTCILSVCGFDFLHSQRLQRAYHSSSPCKDGMQ